MTIFDTLRYPISDRPTLLEIYELPDEIFDCFMKRIGADPAYSRMHMFQDRYHSIRKNVDVLRQCILEYDVQVNSESDTKRD